MHRNSKLNYWLAKSEPGDYSWDDLKRDQTTRWDGVRNYQARNNLKMMKKGDLCFFYHSIHKPAIQGIMEVIGEHYLDPADEKQTFVAVDMKYVKPLARPVSLSEIKQYEELGKLPLLKQSRLSVMPIKKEEWDFILTLASKA